METQTTENTKTRTGRTSPAAPLRAFLRRGPSSTVPPYAWPRPSNLEILGEIINKGEHPPSRTTTGEKQGEESWTARVLRQAEELANTAWADSVMWERKIGVPVAVLLPLLEKPGRPNKTRAIYKKWVAMGRPRITWQLCEELAKRFYPDEFTQAKSGPQLRKKLRDRVGAAIRRHERTCSATKLR